MVQQVSDLISRAQRDARAARRYARSAVGVGVISAVDPVSQTASVTPVGGHQPIPDAVPFSVESPIAVGDLVRVFRQGGQVFVAPIETDLDARLGKDTRVALSTGERRAVTHNGESLTSLMRHRGRDGVIGDVSRTVIFSRAEATRLGAQGVLGALTPVAFSRTVGTLVTCPTSQYRAARVVGRGDSAFDVAGSGEMLPGYCYDTREQLLDTLIGIRKGTGDALTSDSSEELWILEPPTDYRLALIVTDGELAADLSSASGDGRGVRVSFAADNFPAGATLAVTWNPNTANARADVSATAGDYLNDFSDITANAHRLTSSRRTIAGATVAGETAFVIASVDIAGTRIGRNYDVLLVSGAAFRAAPRAFYSGVIDAWRTWREID